MMCGRFGIVTNEGGTSEVVEDGRTGFVADSAKVDEFDKAMERAWAMREEWKSIGQAAGIAVRTMVPLDPAACFTSKLLGVVDSLGASLPRRELQTESIDLSDSSSLLQPAIAKKLQN